MGGAAVSNSRSQWGAQLFFRGSPILSFWQVDGLSLQGTIARNSRCSTAEANSSCPCSSPKARREISFFAEEKSRKISFFETIPYSETFFLS
jgi:hypothetical protein